MHSAIIAKKISLSGSAKINIQDCGSDAMGTNDAFSSSG
jgi:hypothetical protein